MTEMENFIQQAIFKGLDEVNLQRAKNARLTKDLSTPLLGADGALDSLELVNFFVVVEQEIENFLSVSISLSDADLLSLSPSPFESVGALVIQIRKLIAEKTQ